LPKQESSFSEEKEAKRLHDLMREDPIFPHQVGKVFWFFFSKKNRFLPTTAAG
jgi:hypothetical protein